MFAKKLQNGHDKLRVPQFNEKIKGRKVKNNGIEVIKILQFCKNLYHLGLLLRQRVFFFTRILPGPYQNSGTKIQGPKFRVF